jgi:hypothetical protein
MKLSNFKLTETKGKSVLDFQYFATVDVTTGFIFWKKTRTRTIRRESGGLWHFADTGKFTPGFEAETLARAWTAQTGQPT